MKIKRNFFKWGLGLTFSLLVGGVVGLWAGVEKEQPTHGIVVKEMYDRELDVHQYVLSNNVRVNLKSIPYEENRIAIKASFGRGELETPNKQGAIPFVTKLFFMNGGVQTCVPPGTRCMKLNLLVDEDEFSFRGSANQGNFRDLLETLCGYFTVPVYRNEAMRKVQNLVEEIYRSLYKTPQGVLKDKVARFLASGDWKFGYPPENEAKAITVEQIHSFLEKPLKDSYLELSIVGDFDVQECLRTVLETVGALPERDDSRPYLEELRHAQFPEKTPLAKTFFVQEKVPAAFVMVAWPTDDGWSRNQERRLRVLSEIFNDRLRWILDGIIEIYNPSAMNYSHLFYKHYGQFVAFSYVKPTQIDDIQKIFLETALSFRNGITDEEFTKAIKPLLADIDLRERQIEYWLRAINCSQEFPIFLKWAKSLKRTYENMTKEDVQAVAKEFLRPYKAVTIKVMPYDGHTNEEV